MPRRRHAPSLRRVPKRSAQLVAGADEVGRGAWAGPIVAAAVILAPNHGIAGIKDSKQLSPLARERLFLRIRKSAIAWSVAIVSEQDIDQGGMARANRDVLTRAVKQLRPVPMEVLVDGLHTIPISIPCRAIVRGDQTHEVIAAASILAKVTRDRIMVRLHSTYPVYGFDEHKGYGTARHHAALKRNGVSPAHRKSFRPVSRLAG